MKYTHTFILLFLGLTISNSNYAQSPEKLSYQAVIRDASNNLLQNQGIGIKVSIIQGSVSGTTVYAETQTPNTNDNGLVTVEIGTGNVLSGSISSINWANGPYFIKTEIDPTGGTSYTISGASELLSVPYALHAKTAETITGGITETDPLFTASPANGITSSDITTWDNKLDTEVDGSVTNELQTISLSGQVITLSNGGGTITIPSSNGWNITGNSGTTPGTNFIGTTDNKPIIFKANNAFVGKISPGTGDLFLGHLAGNSSTSNTSKQNVGIGSLVMNSVTSGAYRNTAMGYNSLKLLTTGDNNTSLGYKSLNANSTGGYNTAIGASALLVNTSGGDNTAIGTSALSHNTVGYRNVGLGFAALGLNTSGDYNTGIGSYVMYKNVADENTAVGYSALYQNQYGSENSAFGYRSMNKNTGDENSAFGHNSLYTNTSGEKNAAFGKSALYLNTTGRRNVAVGADASNKNTTGIYNTSVGNEALYKNTTGSGNTAVGYIAQYENYGTGSHNTSIGMATDCYKWHPSFGYSSTSNCTAIGYLTTVNGWGSGGVVRLGNSSVSSIGGYSSWTNSSDKRIKTNIKEDIIGLDFIMKLRPVSYNLDMDAIAEFENYPDSLRLYEEEAQKAAEIQTGFIAQEVEKAAIDAGFNFHGVDHQGDESGMYGLRYAEFVVPLVKATQEQQETIKNLEQENQELKQALQELLNRVEQLENK